MKKQVAEFIRTFTLVLIGCVPAVIAGPDIGLTGISFAFGLALIAMAYGIWHRASVWMPHQPRCVVGNGRRRTDDRAGAIQYIVAQIAGAIATAAVLNAIASGKADYSCATNGLGHNG